MNRDEPLQTGACYQVFLRWPGIGKLQRTAAAAAARRDRRVAFRSGSRQCRLRDRPRIWIISATGCISSIFCRSTANCGSNRRRWCWCIRSRRGCAAISLAELDAGARRPCSTNTSTGCRRRSTARCCRSSGSWCGQRGAVGRDGARISPRRLRRWFTSEFKYQAGRDARSLFGAGLPGDAVGRVPGFFASAAFVAAAARIAGALRFRVPGRRGENGDAADQAAWSG